MTLDMGYCAEKVHRNCFAEHTVPTEVLRKALQVVGVEEIGTVVMMCTDPVRLPFTNITVELLKTAC